jgi:hypothetical protein
MNQPQTPTQLLLYQTDDGQTRIQLRSLGGSIWLTQKEIADFLDGKNYPTKLYKLEMILGDAS